jgi:hypothetical protein
LFEKGDYRNTGHNPEKLSRVHVPEKVVSLATNREGKVMSVGDNVVSTVMCFTVW